MIFSLATPHAASQWCDRQRQEKRNLGFVPTMGALHAGHLSLIASSRSENDITCASIFVNPLQFNNPDDLEKYPRDFELDIRHLEEAGCDMVFTGSLSQFFPGIADIGDIASKDPGPAGQGLEGEYRPGHLEGVITIVEQLFNTVGSCNAYFGEKDYQQMLVIKYLSNSFNVVGKVIKVKICPTVREESGLAMSSRNQRLSENQLQIAEKIYLALSHAKSCWVSGVYDPIMLENELNKNLEDANITIGYASIRDQANWTKEMPIKPISEARALVAVTIGGVRLIDNMYLGRRK